MRSTSTSLMPNKRKPTPANNASSAAARLSISAMATAARLKNCRRFACAQLVHISLPWRRITTTEQPRHGITRIKQQVGVIILPKPKEVLDEALSDSGACARTLTFREKGRGDRSDEGVF